MTGTERSKNVQIGIFTTVALAIITLTLLSVGKQNGFFVTSYKLITEFPNVQGLNTGQPVWLNGLEIGLVREINFLEPGSEQIQVVLGIRSDYQQWIREDSLARLETKGLLGDKIVNISVGGQDAEILQDGSRLNSIPAADLTYVMDNAGELVAKTKEILVSIAGIANDVKEGYGTLGKLVTDDALYVDLQQAVGNINNISEGIAAGRGSLGKFVKDDKLYDDLSTVVADVKDGKGTLGKLITTDELYNQLNDASATISRIIAEIEDGQGLIGQATADESELMDNLTAILTSVEALTTDLKQNPGRYVHFSVFGRKKDK